MITHFGLDIGTDSLKLLQVAHDKKTFRLVGVAIGKTPGLGLASESDKDLAAISEAIKSLRAEAKITTSEVVASVPDRLVFTQVIEVPKMKEDELAQAIPWEAENLIPHPLSEVNLDWKIIETKESSASNKMKVLLVAAPTAIVNRILKILRWANLEPLAVETESLAISRCFELAFGRTSFMIGNLGTKSIDLYVIHEGNLFLTRSLPAAGEAITRSVSSSLNLDLAVAEEYKKNYGLSQEFEGKVAAATESVLATAADEFKKAIRFYEEKQQSTIKLLVLTGGTSVLPGLPEYFTKALGIEIQIADPLALVSMDNTRRQSLKNWSPVFSVALGLAMRE